MVQLVDTKSISAKDLLKILESSGSKCLDPALWEKIEGIEKIATSFDNHVWISSSGSQQAKLIALSEQALIASAKAVNDWFELSSDDCWAIALPLNHIGGLSILMRSIERNFKVVHFQERWNPLQFCGFLATSRSTICSLVPTQLYDIVCNEIPAPPSIRAVILGGAKLSATIYKRARELSWPVLPSYGLTECSSQVASASLRSLETNEKIPILNILPHLDCSIDSERVLLVRGSSLLSAHVSLKQDKSINFVKITPDSYFKTQDLAKLSIHDSKTALEIFGRIDRQEKIRGHLVSLDEVESRIETFMYAKKLQLLFAVGAKEDAREGAILALHISQGSHVSELLNELNLYLLKSDPLCPKISEVIEHQNFPLLANGKIDLRALGNLLA